MQNTEGFSDQKGTSRCGKQRPKRKHYRCCVSCINRCLREGLTRGPSCYRKQTWSTEPLAPNEQVPQPCGASPVIRLLLSTPGFQGRLQATDFCGGGECPLALPGRICRETLPPVPRLAAGRTAGAPPRAGGGRLPGAPRGAAASLPRSRVETLRLRGRLARGWERGSGDAAKGLGRGRAPASGGRGANVLKEESPEFSLK